MSEPITTFAATILGAVIAGVISWVIARQSAKETLQRDNAARREGKLAIAFQAFVKLKTIIDSLGTLDRMLGRALSSPPPGATPWMLVEPILGSSHEHETYFEAAEIALFVEANAPRIAEDLQMLARRHATAGIIIAEYNARRDVLAGKMPPLQSTDGNLGTTALTQSQFALVQRDMVACDSLIIQIVPMLKEDLALGLTIARDFGPTLVKHFSDARFPGFLVADQDAPAA